MKKYKVALLQLETTPYLEKNLENIHSLMLEAVAKGVRLIALPEMSNVIGNLSKDYVATWDTTYDFFQTFAKQQGVYIHGGSWQEPIVKKSKCYNTSVFFNDKGEELARYRKIHTFDIQTPNGESYCESDKIQGGEKILVVDTELGKIGFGICYDLRFPELYRKLALLGAEVVINPANFTQTTGEAHWEVLLRSRAIENSCYLVAPNQFGKNATIDAYGHSLLVGPWGEVVCEANSGTGIIVGEIDLEKLHEIRQKMQTLENRKPQLY